MYLVYSIIYTLGFLLMLPAFLLNRQKYASGFSQRLGNYPEFKQDDRKVIWLHCVSVGETNAARPLVDKLLGEFPDHRLIVSTITKTGQELAQKIFGEKVDSVFYFPFDWRFSVRRAVRHFKPSLVLLMETEIWPRFIHEAKRSGAKVAIVNGRLSERSATRYSKVKGFISQVLSEVDLALMQDEDSARRLIELGMNVRDTAIVGNMKYEVATAFDDERLTEYFRERFRFVEGQYLIVAASTHKPEESLIVEAVHRVNRRLSTKSRLLIAPRHPERFENVAELLTQSGLKFVRRSSEASESDSTAVVVLLDSIGELRSVYPLADLVFVGGSLIEHGGQNVLEPAAAGNAIITGPHTFNFAAIVTEFLNARALVQLPVTLDDEETTASLARQMELLLTDPVEREFLGEMARTIIDNNRSVTADTIDHLRALKSA